MDKRQKKDKQTTSIRTKTFSYLIVFSVLLLVILWLLQTVFLDTFYKGIKTRTIKREAAIVAQTIEDNEANLDDLITILTQRGDVYVEVWYPMTGEYLASGRYLEDKQDLSPDQLQGLFQEAEANGGKVTRYTVGRKRSYGKQQQNIHHAQIIESDSSVALMLVSSPLLPVDSTVQTLRVQLFLVSGILVILSVGIAWVFSRQLSKPMADLNTSAKRLGEGDYSVNFSATGYREIEELSETLNQATYELSKMDTLRKELVANVSHDLRTPLTLITGYSEMMRDFPEECSGENLQVIIDESKRLTSLVSDLLDLSKLQAGMHDPQPEVFSITELTAEIIERYAKFREHEHYSIRFETSEDVLVYADPDRIAQVIYNLIGNAINYTGDDKKVLVRQSTQDGRVWLEVIDTGAGLSQHALENVWNRYYREEKDYKRAVTGSGLGLSIVQTILEQHPGVEYGVLSTEGEGSSFWFSLPIEKNLATP